MVADAGARALLLALLFAIGLPMSASAGSFTYAFSGVFTSVENTAPGQPLPPAWLGEGHDVVGEWFSGTFTVDLDGPSYDDVYGSAHRSSYLDPDIYVSLATHTIARSYEHGSSWVHLSDDPTSGDDFSIYLLEAFVSAQESTLVQLRVTDTTGQMLSRHRLPAPIAWRDDLQGEFRVVVGSGDSDSVLRGEIRDIRLVSPVPTPHVPALMMLGGLVALWARVRFRSVTPP